MSDRRQAIIAEVYTEWAQELAGKVQPDQRLSRSGRSQSAEAVELLGADTDAQDDLRERTDVALVAAGLRPTGL